MEKRNYKPNFKKNIKKYKKKNKGNLISNIKINTKLILIFLIFILSLSFVFIIMIRDLSKSDEKYKKEMEETTISAVEQYINTSIDNVVSIANTLYTNSTLYEFLNKNYDTSTEYYDAFYQIKKNNSLSVAESQNITKYTIYTENKTILSGGNFNSSLNSSEEWYNYFVKANKPMIIYCDQQENKMSLIRKLDFYTLNSGNCYLKIDINLNLMHDYFNNINFNGKLLIMNGGFIIYSNLDDNSMENLKITTEYNCYTKNYYTADIEYYSCANKTTFSDTVSDNIAIIIPFLIAIVISLILSYLIVHNIVARINKLNTMLLFNSKTNFSTKENFGNDEIGELYKKCCILNDRMEQKKKDYYACNNLLNKRNKETETILLQALHLDVYMKYQNTNVIKSTKFDIQTPHPLKNELNILKEMINSSNYNCEFNLPNDNEISDSFNILPLSVSFVIINLINDCTDETMHKISMDCVEDDKNKIINISGTQPIESRKLLKLQAIFENKSSRDIYSFQSNYEYNIYIRIKEFYKSSISFFVKSNDEGFKLTFIL